VIRKRLIRKKRGTSWTSTSSALANKVRWDADRATREEGMADRIRELAMIEMENLPHKEGDALGCFQWTDYRSGKVRCWVVRIGARSNQVTLETPGGKPTGSHGGTWVMNHIRAWVFGDKRY
jgi:hypothetical protein